jgi:hypothetical protein
MALSALTAEERQAALDLALQVRQHRSAAKTALKAGSMTLSDLAGSEDPVLAGIRVEDALRALKPGALVALALRALSINARTTFRGLGPLQREALRAAAKDEEEDA